MEQEKNERIKTINTKLTNLILNINNIDIKNGLDFNECNKEINILKKKLNNQCNTNELKIFSDIINPNAKNYDHNISKYYVKLKHIFSTIFNITGNNIIINNSSLNISFDISNCLPDITYVYKTKYDYKNQEFILDSKDNVYDTDLKYFCAFFYKNKKNDNYTNININNVKSEKLNSNKIIFELYFKNYTFYLTLLVQNIKKIHNELLKIVNEYFDFSDENDTYYITNIINIEKMNKIIKRIRDEIITYFFNIENIYKKTNYFFRLSVMDKYCKTAEKRIKNLS